MTSDLVANVHPAAADPQPATGSDRHIAEAVAPVAVPPVAVMAMAVMTATHATTLAPTTLARALKYLPQMGLDPSGFRWIP